MSGAGKSTAITYLEDIGYYCMDNLPPVLLPEFVDLFLTSRQEKSKVAVVVDVRGGVFFDKLFEALAELTEKGIDHKILFLDGSNKELVKRHKEDRRTHPLDPEGSILNGINKERKILEDIKDKAYYTIDTSNLSVKMLEDELRRLFIAGGEKRDLSILVTSFGYKNGVLLDGDLIFDVRFLPNPYYIPELKHISGQNKETQEYVFKWPQTNVFINKLMDMLEFLIPYYIDEGKTQLSIGIGCTGGFHRSVAMVNKLTDLLEDKGHRVVKVHRDLIE